MNGSVIVLAVGIIICIVLVIYDRNRKRQTTNKLPPVTATPVKRYEGACHSVTQAQTAFENDVTMQALSRMMPNLRIVRGTEVASDNKYPFVGALLFDDTLLCSCCLIHPNYALGAAHCISYLELTVVFGSRSLVNRDDKAVVRKVKTFFPHPDFDTVSFDNDICLFEFETPVTTILPACLPYETNELNDVQDFIVAGWGETESSSTSDVLMETILNKSSNCLSFDETTQICASNDTLQSGPCAGDSGSPLFYVNKANMYIICGIVSKGSKLCTSRATTFSKVSRYLPWITNYF